MKASIIIIVDIKDFSNILKLGCSEDIAHYLSTYYNCIENNLIPLCWKIVKTMGDVVLISAEINNTEKDLKLFHKTISEKYNVTLKYRKCEIIEKDVVFDNYSCLDIFGHDINNLFLNDHLTKKMG